jgi:hypothetical protein
MWQKDGCAIRSLAWLILFHLLYVGAYGKVVMLCVSRVLPG